MTGGPWLSMPLLVLATTVLLWGTPMSKACAQDHPAHLPADSEPEAVARALTRHLDDEVLPYWTDPARSAATPAWAEAAGLPIIRQLRLLFVHAVAVQRAKDETERERVRRQYDRLFDTLVSGFRDPGDGAWITATTYDGKSALNGDKQTISQVYLIYVMAETARRISDSRARQLAIDTFAVMDRAGHDDRFGGYVERIDLPLEVPENAIKQLGTNMHVALALSRLYLLAPSALLRERLEELERLLTVHALHPESANGYLAFTRDWRPAILGEDPNQQTLYGHNAELAWYLLEVAEVLHKDLRETLPWVQRVAGGVIRNGIGDDGRVFIWGAWVGPPQDRDQTVWWTQAEAMIMLARLHQLTGDGEYWRLFEKVARFTFDRFVPNHSGAWLSDVNLADGTTIDGSQRPWKAGLHTVRMLLECSEALGSAVSPFWSRRAPLPPRRAVQLEPGFAYYRDRSTTSIVSELKANGFDCIHLICTREGILPPDLVEEAHRQGIEVWGTFFPTGVYMRDDLFPPNREDWRMQFTGGGYDAYRFFSYVHEEYVRWWKEHLARIYDRYDLDGMLWYEVHYPTMKGPTAWGGRPVFGDISPGFAAAFRRATGHPAFPNFTEPDDPNYYETNETLYRDYVEFRINSIMDFHLEVMDGPGGFRRRFPDVPFATWTIALAHPEGLAILRENEAQDPARAVAEVHPDLHFFQTHYPDWSRRDAEPDYVRQYTPYIAAVRAVQPDLPLGMQADVGSTLPWRREPEWIEGFEQICHELGVGTTTYYEFSLRSEIYYQAPRVATASMDGEGRATIAFDQRIDPDSCRFLEGHRLPGGGEIRDVAVDGNLLSFSVTGSVDPEAGMEIPLAGISDAPAVRYPLGGRREPEARGPVNAIPGGVTVVVR